MYEDNNNNNNNNPNTKSFRLDYIKLTSRESLIATVPVQHFSCLFRLRRHFRSPFWSHRTTCLLVTPLSRQIITVVSADHSPRLCFSLPYFFCSSVPRFRHRRRDSISTVSSIQHTYGILVTYVHQFTTDVFAFPSNIHLCTTDSEMYTSHRRSDFGQRTLLMLPLGTLATTDSLKVIAPTRTRTCDLLSHEPTP